MAKLSIPPLVTGVFIVCLLLFKLLFLFQLPFFEDTASYTHLLEIKGTFGDSYTEPISHDINTFLDLKLYYLVMGVIYLLFPSIIVLKIAETVILGLFLFIVYRVTKSLTRNMYAGLVSVILVGSMPLLFQTNQVSLQPEYFVALIFFTLLYLLVKSSFLYDETVDDSFLKTIFKRFGLQKSRRYFKNYYIFFLAVGSLGMFLLSRYSLFFVLVLLFTLSLLLLYRTSIKKYYQEFTIFFTLFSVGIFVLFHREALFTHGFSIFYSNLPAQLLSSYISSFDLIKGFTFVGMPLFLGGIYSIYFYLTNTLYKESAKITVYCSCFFAAIILYIFQVGDPSFLLLIGGSSLAVLFSSYISREVSHAKKYYSLNWSKEKYWLIVVAILLFGGLSINYTLSSTISSENEIGLGDIMDIQELSSMILSDSLVITEPSYGSFVLWFTNSTVVSNSNYLHQSLAEEYYTDISTVYENINSIKVQSVLQSYTNYSEIYIYLPITVANNRNMTSPGFAYDEKCFTLEYNSTNSKLYRYMCGDTI